MASKAKKGKKKKTSAKVHRASGGRHMEEMKLMAYIRRLDKIYTNLDMSGTFLKVVQLLRSKYKDNPHELYLKVCKKWGVEPKEEVDSEFLVYGRSRSLSRSRKNLLKDQVQNKKAEKKDNKEDIKEEKETVEEEKVKASDAQTSAVDEDAKAQAKPEVKIDENQQKVAEVEDEYVSVLPGDIVETMVLIESTSERETGFWVPAQILSINEDAGNMDLQVLQPLKYNLAEKAVAVPYRYVRSPATVTFER